MFDVKSAATDNVMESLKKFEKTITVHSSDPFGVLGKCLAKEPALALYIESVKAQTSFGVSRLYLTYGSTDLPLHNVYYSSDGEDFESDVHDILSACRIKAALRMHKSLLKTAMRRLEDLLAEFSVFYSNLLSFEYSAVSPVLTDNVFLVLNLEYRIGSVMLGIMRSAVEKEVKRLSSVLFCDGMSDAVKVLTAHNYLARNVEYYTYDDPNPLELSYRQSAYGALINKRCVCQGYAEAFKRLLDAAGVPCRMISGKIRKEADYHAWNVVSVGGRSYHVDVTWDSAYAEIEPYKYFCLPDSALTGDRLWSGGRRIACDGKIGEVLSLAKRDIAINGAKYAALGVDKRYLK